MCDSIYHMTQMAPRAILKNLMIKSPVLKPYASTDRAGKIAYGPAWNVYWSMQVCSIKKIQKQMIRW